MSINKTRLEVLQTIRIILGDTNYDMSYYRKKVYYLVKEIKSVNEYHHVIEALVQKDKPGFQFNKKPNNGIRDLLNEIAITHSVNEVAEWVLSKLGEHSPTHELPEITFDVVLDSGVYKSTKYSPVKEVDANITYEGPLCNEALRKIDLTSKDLSSSTENAIVSECCRTPGYLNHVLTLNPGLINCPMLKPKGPQNVSLKDVYIVTPSKYFKC